MEDGVEVIINHLEPYKIEGEPNELILEEEFRIDSSRSDLVKAELSDLSMGDIDSDGNIYFVNSIRKSEKIIYKFNKKGEFITCFCRKGQGPGEIQWVSYFGIEANNNIIISDHNSKKILLFDRDGKLIQETHYNPIYDTIVPLENGKYLAYQFFTDLSRKTFSRNIVLCNSIFEEIKKLDTCKVPDPFKLGRRGAPLNAVFLFVVSKGKIYVGNEDRGYEIFIYDLNGNLLKKIRKEYESVKIPEKLIKERRKRYEGTPGLKVFFPVYYPAFNFFIIDDEGRLYVRTWEKGENAGEYIFDIFNPDGIFIMRKSMKTSGFPVFIEARVNNNRLYCLREKESGYKELVVYKMIWK